jgi:hypothetical protein
MKRPGQAIKMAEIKLKSEAVEKAIAFVFSKMDKDVKKRQWTAAAYGALIRAVAEATGAKWANGEGRKTFAELMKDSDLSFSSNFKKYAENRGFLPKGDEYVTVSFE